MEDLLTRDYACRHSCDRRPWGKEQIAVCIVEVQRGCRCELIFGAIQGERFNGLYQARELYGSAIPYAAAKVKRGGRELVMAGPNPLAVPGGHKLVNRRPRGYDDAPRRDQATVTLEGCEQGR